MSRSLKKGPFVETRLLSRITAMNEAGKKDVVKTWSRASTIFPEMVGHHRRPRRSQARARVCYRVHGWSQARRVRADSYVPWPQGQIGG